MPRFSRGLQVLVASLCLVSTTVALSDPAHRVPTVVVSKTPGESVPSATLGAMQQFSAKQIQQTGAVKLTEVLQSLAGLQVQNNGKDSTLTVSGFGATSQSNLLILINGEPLSSFDYSAADLDMIALGEIASIEYVPGSAGVLYGDSAVAGSLNIKTKAPKDGGGKVQLGVGSFQAKTAGVSVNHAWSKALQLHLAAHKSRAASFRRHNNQSKSQATLSLAGTKNDETIRFESHIARSRVSLPGALTAAEKNADRRQGGRNTGAVRTTRVINQLHWLHVFSETLQSAFHINHNQTDETGRMSGLAFTQSHQHLRAHPELTKTLHWQHRAANLKFGGEFSRDSYSSDYGSGKSDNRQVSGALYSLLKTELTTRFTASLGARVGYARAKGANDGLDFTKHYRVAVTEQTLSLQASQNLRFALSREGSYRLPKADENTFSADNKPLNAQVGETYTLSAVTTKPSWNARAALYWLRLKHEISYARDPNNLENPTVSNRNLPKTERFGFRLGGNVTLTSNLSLGAAVNAVRARFSVGANRGKRIPQVAELTSSAHLTYQVAPDWQFTTEWLFTGNRFAAMDDANATRRQGGRSLFNLELGHQWRQLNVKLRVDNVSNKAYDSYTIAPTPSQKYYYPAAGRQVRLTAAWEFS